jgi:copper chaperone
MKNVTIQVQGMSCNHCVNSVEGALKNLGAQGKVDLAVGQVSVEYDEIKLNLEVIKAAIEEEGYTVVSK